MEDRTNSFTWSRRSLLLTAGLVAGTARAIVAPGRAHADDASLLVNGDFEAPTVSGEIPGWRIVYGDAQSVRVITDQVHGGAQALLLDDRSTSESAGVLSAPFKATPGSLLRTETWVLANDTTPPLVYLRFYDEAGGQVGQVVKEVQLKPGAWSYFTFTAAAPEEAATGRLILYSPSSRATAVWWDDVTVGVEAPQDGPLVTNGGFETPPTDEAIPGWRVDHGDSGSAAVVTSAAHNGQRALHLVARGGGRPVKVVNDSFRVRPGANLRVDVWLLARNARPCGLGIDFHDAEGRLVTEVTRQVRATPRQWSAATEVIMVPDGARSAAVTLSAPGTSPFEVWWDDVAATEVTWQEERLGEPVVGVTMTRAAFGAGPDGGPLVFAACAGNPARYEVLDVRTGGLVDSVALDDAKGSWAIARGKDGRIYIGTYELGQMYRWDPATRQLESLGRPTPAAAYIWDLEVDDDGVVWGSSYPDAELFSYDPATGEFTNHGSMADDEEYAHALAVVGDTVVVGLGTNRARLVAYNPATGAKSVIELPEEHRGNGFAFDVDARGDHLLVRARVGDHSVLLSHHLPTATWTTLEPIGVFAVSPVGPDGHAYYVALDGTLKRFSPDIGTVSATSMTGLDASRGLDWVQLDPDDPSATLASFDGLGRLALYNPATGAGEVRQMAAEGTPVQLQAITTGPDGAVYVGGYQFSGLSRFRPDSGEVEQFTGGVQQVEGLHTHGRELYLGDYGGAGVYRFDPSRPWADGTNPRQFAKLADQGQDRPFAWASAGTRVAFGTVPGYGLLGGALGIYDPATDTLETHVDVVPDQSVVALTATAQTIYGGTSVHGGGGTTPSAALGKVFAWDLQSGSKVWEVAPLPDARAVTSLTIAPDGNLWGATVGSIFEMGPDGRVLRTLELARFGWTSSRWVSDHIRFGADGYLYVLTAPVSRATLWQIDPVTFTRIQIATGITYWSFAQQGGDIYFKRQSELCRLRRS